ncbi:MAG TPA: hypothetical protein VF134_06665 [Candidatus Dormibacteraeota bacterium]
MTRPLPLALIVLAVIFLILALLYLVGVLQVFTSTGSGSHWKHALVLAVLAVLCLVGANFARNRGVPA